MMRRTLLTAAPAVAVLASAGVAPAAAAAPSPILDAARQIAALGREYDAADVAGADGRELDAIWRQVWAHEATILGATPATVLEATAVLLVAAGNLDRGACSDDNAAIVDRAMHATARATRFLAGTAGATLDDIGGGLYLPDSAGFIDIARAA